MAPSATEPVEEAALLDTIDAVSEPLSSMDSISPLVALLAMSYKCHPTPTSITDPVSHEPRHADRLSTLMRTMAPSCKDHQHEEMGNSFIRLLSPVLNGMAGMSEFEEAVGAFSDPDDFRDFWTFEGKNLIKEVVEGTALSNGNARGHDLPFVNIFVKNPSCRIAMGEKDRMLRLVPGDAMPGDEIWQQSPGSKGASLRVVRSTEPRSIEVGKALIGH